MILIISELLTSVCYEFPLLGEIQDTLDIENRDIL